MDKINEALQRIYEALDIEEKLSISKSDWEFNFLHNSEDLESISI